MLQRTQMVMGNRPRLVLPLPQRVEQSLNFNFIGFRIWRLVGIAYEGERTRERILVLDLSK